MINGLAGDDELEGLAGDDQLNGGDDNDIIYAGYGDDLADSGGGDDYIFGGFGNDTMTGGDGFDTVSYFDDDAVTGVTVDLNAVGAQNTGQGMDTLSGIEGLGGTQFADTLTGDDNANWLTTVLITGPGNDDTMDGRGGDDLISVGIGNHVLTGGDDNDTLRFINGNTPTTAITLSLAAQGGVQATGAGNWTYSGFENLSGGRAGDTLTGDGDANRLTGEGGNDIIDGGGGNDILSGDASWNMGFHANGTAFGPAALRFVTGPTGDDSLDGGTGDDTAIFLFEAGAGTLTIVADGADYLVRRDAVDVARISFSGATITVTGLNSGANLGTDTLTNIEHLSFAIDGGAPVIFDVPGTNDDPVITSGPGDASGSATEAISLDGIPGADQTSNNRLEPVINYDAAIVSLLAAHPNDMASVLAGLQAQLPAGSGIAEAIAIVWDYVDDNFSYYNTVINEISARLTVEYALYLEGGGPALTGTAAKYTPDGGDVGTAPDRYQSLHDNILGNVNGEGLNDKFRGPPNGSNPTPDEDAYNRIIQLLADEGLSDLVNRPVYSGTEGAANLSLAYDQANGLLPATSGQLTATDPDFDPLEWSGSAQGIYGTFTINATTGAWSYLLDQFDPDTQALGAGESDVETFTATVSDGNGGSATQEVTITVFGTNDAPVGVANALLAGGSEDVVYHVTLAQLLAGFSDLDGDILSVAGLTADHGSVAAEPGGFAITLDPDYYGPVVLSYQVDDGNGGSISATQTFAVASVNDAPTVTGPVLGSATEGGGVYAFDPLANASDVDGDSLVVIPTGVLPAGVSFVGGSAATIDFSGYALGSVVGQFGWTDATPSSPDNEIVDVSGNRMLRLANDPTSGDFGGPFSPAFAISAGEAAAAADTLSFSFTVKAVNGVPDGSRIEIDLGSSDRDDRYNFMALEYVAGGLRLVQNTPLADGNWANNNFDFGVGNVQLGALLDASVSHTIQVVFRAVDGSNNDIVEYYVDGNLVGTGSTFENFAEFHLAQPHASAINAVNNVLFRAGDPAGNPFPADGPGGNRQGFYIDDLNMAAYDSHQLRFDADDPAYDHLALGQTEDVTITYNVADGHGGVTPTSTVITVTGINDGPVAVDDVDDAIEDGPLVTGSVAANDSDPDDGETATLEYTLNAAVAGLTLNPDGSYSFDPTDAAYQHLAAGRTLDVVATYTVTDAQNATDTATLTITVTGTNDAPVVSGAVLGSATEGGGVYTFDPLANATDPDDGDSLAAVPVGPLPAGVSFVGETWSTDFEDYTPGTVVGQHGWTDGSPGSPDNAIVDLGGDKVLRLANDPSSGDFAGPYTPELGFPVGEAGSGDTLSFSFTVKAVNGTADGSRLEIDLATAAQDDRYNFMALEYVAGGLRLVQNTPLANGVDWANNSFDFGTGNVQLGALLDASVEHVITVIFRAVDGPDNDIVEYYVDGVLVGTGSSFENYNEFHVGGTHANAVREVTGLLFRAGEPAGNPFPADGPGGNRQGFYIDDLRLAAYDSQQLHFDANDPAYDHLAAGATELVTVHYNVVDLNGGVTPATTVITVTGINDAATITGTDTGAVVEAGVGPGNTPNPGTPTASGTLTVNDVDDGENELVPILAGTAGTGGYGTFEVAANGAWTYTLNNADPDTHALPVGQVVTDTITVISEDGTDTQVITVTITGTNDLPVVTGPVMASATEGNGLYIFNPLANASDPDAGDGLVVIPVGPLPAGVSFVGASAATINFDNYADGSVVGQFGWTDASPSSPDNAIVDLGGGDKVLRLANDPSSGDFGGPYSPAFVLSAGEGPAAADTLTFSFEIKAVNGVADGSRIEIDLGSSDRDDRYNFMAIEYTAGGLRLVQNTPERDGDWQSNDFNWGGNVQLGALLNASVAHTIQVIFRAVDGSNNDIVEYYVDGVLVGTGSTFENFAEFHLAQPHASAINAVNNVLFRAGEPAGNPVPGDGPGGLARQGFYIDDLAMSAYDSHQLQFNANDPAYDHLVAGATQLVTVNYNVADGHGGVTATSTVITVTGTNDGATITGIATGAVVEAGVGPGNTPNPGTPTASGTLVVNDVDDGENELVPVPAGTAGTGGYGTFEVAANGAWTYTLNNADTDTNALYLGQVVTDTITVTSEDGTDSQVITVTITGTNDLPVVTGPVLGSATEGGGVYAFDPLANASDPDTGDGLVAIPTGVLPAGVSFVGASSTIDFTGYALGSVVGQFGWTDATPSSPDNEIVDVSGNRMLRLANDPTSGDFGGPYSPTFAFSAGETGTGADGDTLSFSFVIRAVNNVADGSRIEIDLGTSSRDDRYNFMAIEYVAGGLRLVQNTPLATTNGDWANNNFDFGTGNVQLGALLDASVAHSIQVIFRAVDGSNNDIVEYYVDGNLVGTGSTFENFREFHLAQPHASAVTSVDNVLFRAGDPAGNPFPADGPGGNRQGFYIDDLNMAAYDSHQLRFDADDPAYDHLALGQTEDVTITYNVADGHGGVTPTSTVITVTGTNDGPVAVDDTNSAFEDGATLNGSVATNDSDVDDGETATLVYTLNASVAGLTLDPDGSYSFDPAHAAYQSLAAGQTLDVVATYTVTDAQNATDTATLTITVTGTNDAPTSTLIANDTRTYVEGGPPVTLDVLGNGTIADIDSANFGGGSLTLAFASPLAEDNLFIINNANVTTTSNPAGGGNVVSVNGIAIGTFSGGSGGTPFVILFNANATPAAVQLLARAVGYANSGGDNPTAGLRTIGWTLDDGDGNANGGNSTLSFNSRVNVLPANDSPDSADFTVMIDEDETYHFNGSIFPYSDPEGNPPGSLRIDSLPSHGTLYFDPDGAGAGAPFAVSPGLSVSWASLPNLFYVPDADYFGSDSFIFAVVDSGGAADATPNTLSFDIGPVNDAAVITGDAAGDVTEAGGVANGTPGDASDTGDLDAADVDNTSDGWQAAAAGSATVNGYGTYQLSAAGVWTYTLNDNHAAVQALNGAATLTDSFTALTEDGTAQLVTVTIHAQNDAAVITGTAAGDVTEAGGVGNGTPGTPTATGDLEASDVDNTADAWQAAAAGSATVNGYGTYQLSAAGVWTYTLNDNNAAVQALNGAATLTDSFTATTADGTTQIVTITIHAQNDAAVITGTATGDVTEAGGVANGTPGTPTATGNLDASDVDNTADAWQAIAAGAATANGYGTYQLSAAGVWTYTLNDNHAAVQALNGAATLTDTFSVLTADGTAQLVTVTIHAQNDAAVITGDAAGDVTEAGGVANGTPGIQTDTGDLNAADVDNTNDAWQAVAAGGATANGYGTYQLSAAGVWTYTLDNNNAAVQALNGAATLTDTFTALTADGTAQLVTVTIHAQNDAAVITGTASGDVTEAGGVGNGTPGTPTATGDLEASDVDNMADAWQAVAAGAATANGYGSYALSAAGVWTYTLNDNHAAVQALNGAATLTDTFTVLTADGTAQLVTITIHAQNDAAVITGTATGDVTEAGGVANGTPGTPTATGNLDASDVDNTADAWQVVAAGAATANGYGSYALSAAGVWTYTLNDNHAAVQALNGAATLTDTFTVLTADGTAQLVTITIHAQNDAAVITGTATGDVTEAGGVANGTPGTPTATGNLDASDVDNTADAWQVVAAGAATANGYGTYQLSAAGVWTYTLDDNNAAVQALNGAATLTDTFSVLTADGTAQTVTITIHAQNDAATITGTATGDVTEAGGVNNGTPGTPTATGDLAAADVDNPVDSWQAVAAGAATANGYGTYALNAAGVWTYTLNDNHAAVQALNGAATLTDTFTVLTADGTAQLVTITIHAQNDAAVITGTATGDVTEAGGVANGTPGTPTATGNLDASDVDNTADAWQAVAAGAATANGYGTYQLSAAGVWTYTLNDNHAAVQALNGAATLTDTFSVLTADGTAQLVTVTIHAQNDAAVITGDAAGDVTEAGGVANGTPGIQTDTGDLDAADVDNTNDAWQAVAAGGATANGYGTYQLSAAGVWTYTLDNNNAAVQALNGAATLTDTFTALTADGTAQLVTITINAQDDAPVARPDAFTAVENAVLSGNVFPDNGSGADSDVDGPALQVSAVNGMAVVGTQITLASGARLTVNANGTFSYDPNHAFDTLPDFATSGASNTTAPDSFTYTLAGGNTVTVTLTIRGVDSNDVLFGTAGNDMLAGGIGNDTYFVGNAGDQIIEAANQGYDVVAAAVSYTLTAGAHVELMTTGWIEGTALINLTGNELAQQIWGNAAANTLSGGDGDDELFGFGGSDTLIGGNGKDVMFGGAGANDSLQGGLGDDTYFIDDAGDVIVETGGEGHDVAASSLDYVLGAGVSVELMTTGWIGGTATINLTGNDLGNEIWGNDGVNQLNGGGGNVTDALLGFGGNDRLDGGAGLDLLVGGTGQDSFVFANALSSAEADIIADFSSADDTILLDDAVFAGLSLGALNANAFVTGTAAVDADDRIIYDAATGKLYFDADGNGAGAAVQFATLLGNPVLTASDFTVI